MKLKILLPFFLLISLMLAGLLFLSSQILKNEERIFLQNHKESLQARLGDIRNQIEQSVNKMETDIQKSRPQVPLTKSKVFQFLQEPLIKNIFMTNQKGGLLYPNESSKEFKVFLGKTQYLWDNNLLPGFAHEPSTNSDSRQYNTPIQGGKSSNNLFNSLDTQAKQKHFGWIPWYWEDGLQLLHWKRTTNNYLLCAEISRISVLATIIGDLPTKISGTGRMILKDSKYQDLYQWGAYEPEENELSQESITLKAPLNSWTLHFYGPLQYKDELRGSFKFNLIVSGAIFILSALFISFYLIKEFKRENEETLKRMNFVTQVSHELKTPLTNIRMYAELLEDKIPDEEKPKNYIHVITQESQRLSRLISNILTFNTSSQKKLKVFIQELDINELTLEVLDQFRPSLEKSNFEIILDLQADKPVAIDRDFMGQVICNLINNVEKYAQTGKYLKISSYQDQDSSYLEIEDKGPGISNSHINHIFKAFYRVSNQLSDGVSGTGIGLAIAKDLMKKQNGEIILKSPASTQTGACFQIQMKNATREKGL